jgi:CheY-like chemotaxis protein
MPERILIVEDNEHSRTFLGLILGSAGYEVLEAENGTQAIEKALTGSPDLILMDLGLPDMTGIDAARLIKANPTTSHIPIMAYSAWSAREWREEALGAGMVEYLQKPVETELIKAKIEKFLLRVSKTHLP